jgi:phosphoribosylanthranilate isomerase
MQLKTKVKVGNITNLSDARYCAGMGVDLLGFPIGDHTGQISFDTFLEIAEWVAGPAFILEYADSMDDEQFQKVTQSTAVQFVQLNYDQLLRLGTKIEDLSIILITSIAEWKDIKAHLSTYNISYLVLDETITPEWATVEEINSVISVLVPQHLIDNISDVESLPIAGILMEGSSEDKPGQKDYDHLATILEALELD